MNADEARSVLQARPSSAEATASVVSLRDAVAQAVSQAAGGLEWQPVGEQSSAGCGAPFSGLDATTVFVGDLLAPRAIHEQWAAAQEAAQRLAADAGFTEVVVKVDRPDNHQVRFVSPDGAYLDLGTKVTTLVSGATGCHLP
ncbi:LppA family lipoprotein [Rhodococcus sp. X156]|uniref:LppA family lipoprotein n=1 Tax=Rhodococcus sp. X156 TaxID=2499145 RepID=UPI000FDBC32A|nr:LppA family lipoprotein [Rhodococcus sp. X156]